jgi:hypothetical protein
MSRICETRLMVSPIIIAIVAGFAVASIGDAQPTGAAYRHRALGVYDRNTGDPIEGVGVIEIATGTMAQTTVTGTVDLVFLPDGGAMIRVRKLGYRPIEQFVRISPLDTTPITVLLVSETMILPAVVARDSSTAYRGIVLREFEGRRAKGGPGQFIDEKFLRNHPTRSMPDIVRGFTGVTVLCTRSGFYVCEAVTSRTPRRPSALGGDCRFAVFVDGVNVRDPDLTKLVVGDFAGIEAYTAGQQIPPGFAKNGNPCGALLFWSRER